MLEMGEYSSPYTVTIEGFANPTMESVFQDLLTVKIPSNKHLRRSMISSDTSIPSVQSVGNTCNTASSKDQLTTVSQMESDVDSGQQTSFLRSILVQQRDSVKSLLETAKMIGPVAQKIEQKEQAYDAAFESDRQAVAPLGGGNIQGFALLFFIVSFIAFTIVCTIAVNELTHSHYVAGGAFIGFLILGIVFMALIVRLG
jgi:hypothetical protein